MTDPSSAAVGSIAQVALANAARYLQQLCKHFQHRRPVTFDERSGHIEFPMGECRLSATDTMLTLSLAAPDAARLTQLQEVVANHLLRFAFRDPPTIEWQASDIDDATEAQGHLAPPGTDADRAPHADGSQGQATAAPADGRAGDGPDHRSPAPPSPAAPPNPFGPIRDPKVRGVIERLHATRRFPQNGGPRGSGGLAPEDFAEYGFSIHPDQGDLIYLLCRGMGARRVVDFATSVGMSALYFAASMRDNGGGLVIGSELVPAKAETARRNLAEAGLDSFVDIRVGDARATLRDLGGPVDFVLIDGWPMPNGPSLAREVIEIVAPQLRVGGYVLNDNAEPDFLEFIRDPANGFLSMTLPLKGGTELALKVR